MVLKKLFARSEPPPRMVRLPAGERVYAIGDIHGRRDCLDQLLEAIDADDEARGPAETTLVFLGDLVDRGPDSRGVVERAIKAAGSRRCVFLMGNHEEILIHTWEGDRRTAGLFHRVGGRETMLSYGISAHDYDGLDLPGLVAEVGARVPPEHIAFIRRFADSWRAGDYLFVHAGVRPGVALDAQSPADLRWIRREFLDDDRDHGAMVIHGHSITEAPDVQPNRIGIDTGAFASGKLTAIGLEGATRWFLTG
jgi:serine/threonine protein phosphatase 1